MSSEQCPPADTSKWKKMDMKDVIECVQWKPGRYDVIVSEHGVPTSKVGVWCENDKHHKIKVAVYPLLVFAGSTDQVLAVVSCDLSSWRKYWAELRKCLKQSCHYLENHNSMNGCLNLVTVCVSGQGHVGYLLYSKPDSSYRNDYSNIKFPIWD